MRLEGRLSSECQWSMAAADSSGGMFSKRPDPLFSPKLPTSPRQVPISRTVGGQSGRKIALCLGRFAKPSRTGLAETLRCGAFTPTRQHLGSSQRVRRGNVVPTTISNAELPRPLDRTSRVFKAERPSSGYRTLPTGLNDSREGSPFGCARAKVRILLRASPKESLRGFPVGDLVHFACLKSML